MPRPAAGRPARDVPPVEGELPRAGSGPPALPPGRRPFDHGVLAMGVFLASEAMLFAGLISAFLILRAGAPSWPPPGQPRLPARTTGLNTAVLLLSAWTMQRAAGATRGRRRGEMLRWLATTAALGTTFLLVQGVEWIRLIRHGLGLASSVYGASFYTLIGCHGLHVAAAVVTLVALLGWALRRESVQQCRTRVEVCRLYWLFVVAVWPVLYVLVYLA
jgi:heme/copper-type cytochrome/quinol oxidase subunit 3